MIFGATAAKICRDKDGMNSEMALDGMALSASISASNAGQEQALIPLSSGRLQGALAALGSLGA